MQANQVMKVGLYLVLLTCMLSCKKAPPPQVAFNTTELRLKPGDSASYTA
jgi:hypothetical protein